LVFVSYLCGEIDIKNKIMAKPIKETPLLTGEDATRFEQAAQEVVPASEKEINEAREAFDYFASIATFSM
jgi:hypothetical protein